MKRVIPHLAIFFMLYFFSCSDEFEIRKGIEGRWKIRSIRWTSPELNMPGSIVPDGLIDSLLLPNEAFIVFSPCDREGRSWVCEAEVTLLGLTQGFRYDIIDDKVSVFFHNHSRKRVPLSVKMDILFWGVFSLTKNLESQMVLERQGQIILKFVGQSSRRKNTNIKMELTRVY